jgi:hypothetical protein
MIYSLNRSDNLQHPIQQAGKQGYLSAAVLESDGTGLTVKISLIGLSQS